MNTLNVKSVQKSYGKKQILTAVGLQCCTGKITGIFGRNGCGKSTLLKILFGTVKADNNEIYINDILFKPEHNINNQHIAYLPQESFLPKNLLVSDVIIMYFEDNAIQDKLFYHKAISRFTKCKVGTLSMGEIRLLELLLVGNLNHSFLLLDEPFAMIEPIIKEYIKEFLIELKGSKGIIATDHYYKDILEIADENYIIDKGKSFKIADVNDLKGYGYIPA